jgi:Mg-chelatase subunit ChlD
MPVQPTRASIQEAQLQSSEPTLGDQLNDQKMAKRMRTSYSGASVIFTLAFLFVSLGVALCAGSAFAAQPLDVVFVLDNSGSMKQNDPEFLTRRAVADFADALAAESELEGRLAIVLFDGQASLVQRLTPAGDLASTRLLGDALDELDFSGQRTNSPSGIERALYELRERGRADAEQAIIFLSDGKIDTGDSANDIELARWLREDLAGESAAGHVRIFGIAFTEDADYQLMQALARRTKGSYYRAFAAGELATVVEDVLAKVATPQLAGRNPFEPGFTDDERNAVAAESPDVAATPFLDHEDEEAGGPGILALLPVALLVVSGALFYRRQGGNWGASVRSPATPDAPPAQLLDIGGHAGTSGQAFALEPGCTTIGRDANNSIVLRDDTISSEHALIENCDGRYWLRDLRSTNGTCLADKRLDPDERVPLKSGDHVRFAEIDLMFVVKGYLPGGATVYLSPSTVPPAESSMIAASRDPGIPVAVHEKKAEPSKDVVIGDESSYASLDASLDTFLDASLDASLEAPLDEIAFAEERARLDPASVVNLDEELSDAATDEDSASLGEPKGDLAISV